jgi:N-acetylmuramoyl-L-alanine amidase
MLAALLLILCGTPAEARLVSALVLQEGQQLTLVGVDLSASAEYSIFTLANPHRVVVDLRQARPAPGFSTAAALKGQSRVRAVRTAVHGGDYRLVLDVDGPVRPQGARLETRGGAARRLVFELHGAPAAPVTLSLAGAAASPTRGTTQAKPDLRDLVVAIDAGHGGQDPGAIGPGRIQEKHVTLNIARKLAAEIDRIPGYRARLVRSGDNFIALRDRVRIAREFRADLFVSIHADAFRNPRISGGSVYTLSDRGATSENARWLAEKENGSDLLGGVGDVSLDDKDDMLAHVLLDLSMTANRSASIEAGQAVLQELAAVGRLHKRRVEQAGFVVLKSPDMPSILVETGFISNPEEARRLNTQAHQNRLVQAIAAGVRRYLENNAPPGTLVAARTGRGGSASAVAGAPAGSSVRYVIARGDTLSGIASRYGVPTQRLRSANGLRSDVIRIGQTLLIPAG